MGNNVTEKGLKAEQIRSEKRAAALRENLKRRKAERTPDKPPVQGETKDATGENDG